jgi:cobalamin biosynthesis Co2+ chelatase CbiK
LNVLEGIQYKLIARVVRKHSGKINCLGSVAKKILVKIRNDVNYEDGVVNLEEIKKKFVRRMYDVIPVLVGLGVLEHSNKNCYVIKNKDKFEELYNDSLNKTKTLNRVGRKQLA